MKKTYIECLRIIAVILVIYNHTREVGFTLYQYTSDAFSYYFSIFMIPVCKTAVPIFLMISGANLLGKTEDYRQLFHRIIKYSAILLFWGTLQYFRYARTGKTDISIRSWWSNIYSSPKLETYWYLYLYLGFLLMLPLLRKAASRMEDQDYRYLFVLSGAGAVLTMAGYLSGCFINGSIFILPAAFLYPLLGYWIDHENCQPHDRGALKYGLAALLPLCIVITVSLVCLKRTDYSGDIMDLIQCFTMFIAFGIFGFVKRMDAGYLHSMRLKKAVIAVGGTAFGIYLTEDMIRNQVIRFVVYINAKDFIIAILYTLFTFILGVAAILVMKKIPVLKKLI